MPERVASILADYAIEVRKLAYILPSGIGETEALRLSQSSSIASSTSMVLSWTEIEIMMAEQFKICPF